MENIQGEKDSYSIYMCLYLSDLCWAKKTGIFILGTLTIITVENILILTFKVKQKNYKRLIALTHVKTLL